MKGSKEIKRAVLAELGRLGIRAQVVYGGVHPKVIWEHNGQMRVQILPGSPSDFRAKRNNICSLKRQLRKDGVL